VLRADDAPVVAVLDRLDVPVTALRAALEARLRRSA
jgi:hypothetical protein